MKNKILKVNGFYISHIYLSIETPEKNFIQDVEFTPRKDKAKKFTFNEAYKILIILAIDFKDLEIDEVNDEI